MNFRKLFLVSHLLQSHRLNPPVLFLLYSYQCQFFTMSQARFDFILRLTDELYVQSKLIGQRRIGNINVYDRECILGSKKYQVPKELACFAMLIFNYSQNLGFRILALLFDFAMIFIFIADPFKSWGMFYLPLAKNVKITLSNKFNLTNNHLQVTKVSAFSSGIRSKN